MCFQGQGQVVSRAPCLSTCLLVPSVDHSQPRKRDCGIGLPSQAPRHTHRTLGQQPMPRRLATRPGERCGAIFEPESMEGIGPPMVIAPAYQRRHPLRDANSTANHARPKHSAMGTSTQDVVVPFHHWTRDLFGHHASYYHRHFQRYRWYVETSVRWAAALPPTAQPSTANCYVHAYRRDAPHVFEVVPTSAVFSCDDPPSWREP